MVVRVKTAGETVRAYVGTKRVAVGPDGQIDPLQLALAQLRLDCEADRRRLMADFRWHVEKRSDVFGRREEQWQDYLRGVHERREAERAEAAARRAERVEGEAQRDKADFGRYGLMADLYDSSITITSEAM